MGLHFTAHSRLANQNSSHLASGHSALTDGSASAALHRMDGAVFNSLDRAARKPSETNQRKHLSILLPDAKPTDSETRDRCGWDDDPIRSRGCAVGRG